MSQSYRQGERIFAAGDRADFVVLVDQGTVWVTTSDAKSGYIYGLGLRGTGELVGDFGCINGTVRGGSAYAWTPVRAYTMESETFLRMLRGDNQMMFALLKGTIARLYEADQRRLEFGSRTGFDHVARVVLDLHVRFSEPTAKNHELGALAGVSPLTAGRAIGKLTKQGVLTRFPRDSRIVVHDLEKLRAIVSGEVSR